MLFCFFFFFFFFFFSSRRRHTRLTCDWSSDVCSSDLRDGRPPGRDPARADRERLSRSAPRVARRVPRRRRAQDRKSTRLNSSHMSISYAVFCLKKKKNKQTNKPKAATLNN